MGTSGKFRTDGGRCRCIPEGQAWVFWIRLALTVGLGLLNGSGPLGALAVEFFTSIGWVIVLAWVLAVATDKFVITMVGRH